MVNPAAVVVSEAAEEVFTTDLKEEKRVASSEDVQPTREVVSLVNIVLLEIRKDFKGIENLNKIGRIVGKLK